MAESANPEAMIHTVGGAKRLAYGLLGALVRRWQRTLRYAGEQEFGRLLRESPTGMLVLCWHNRLFPCIGALQRVELGGHRIHALVSASRDGAVLSHFLEAQGLYPVRGSSSRRGAVAARELLKLLAQGHHVAITVDGPRGPRYQAQPGAAWLVRQTGAPVCFVSAECESCRELASWDRFIVPRPFSRVRIVTDHHAPDDLPSRRDQQDALRESIQQKLRALTRDTHRRP